MGMTELYLSTIWVNCNTWFTSLLMGTFSYLENIQRNLLWASIFAANGKEESVEATPLIFLFRFHSSSVANTECTNSLSIQNRSNGSWTVGVCFPSSFMQLHCPNSQLMSYLYRHTFFSPLFGIACHPWLDKWFSNFSHQVNTSFGFPAYWGAFSLRAVSSLPSFSKVSSFASPLITFELLLCTAPSFCSKACLSYSICSNLCNINCNSGLGDLPLPRLL